MNFRFTKAVKGLLIACVAAFVVQNTIDRFFGGHLLQWLGLVPGAFAFEFRFWQLFTYAFLHADVMHLFLNLMMLAFVGAELESLWGTSRFLKFYFACTSAAALFYLLLQGIVWGGAGANLPLVGASGGIYGLLMAYGLLFSERSLLFMMVFPMKAKQFVWVLVALEFMTTVFGNAPGSALSALAHLGGLGAGFVYLLAEAHLRKRMRKSEGRGSSGGGGGFGFGRKSASRKASHLKLVVNQPGERPPSDPKADPKSSQPASGVHDRFGGDDDSDPTTPKTWH